MDPTPEQPGGADEADGALISRLTAGTAQIATEEDDTATTSKPEASDVGAVNSSHQGVDMDSSVVSPVTRCGEESSSSSQQHFDTSQDASSVEEQQENNAIEPSVVEGTSNDKETSQGSNEQENDIISECMEVSELSPARSSIAEGPQVGQVSTTTNSPLNVPAGGEDEQKVVKSDLWDEEAVCETHETISPSSDAVVSKSEPMEIEGVVGPTTTIGNVTESSPSPISITDNSGHSENVLNSAHHGDVTVYDSVVQPCDQDVVVPSARLSSSDEVPSSSTNENHLIARTSQPSQSPVINNYNTDKEASDVIGTTAVNNQEIAVTEDSSMTGSDVSWASLEVHASKSLVVSSVSDAPSSDEVVTSPRDNTSNVVVEEEHSIVPPDSTPPTETVTTVADSMEDNVVSPRKSPSPSDIVTTVDSTTGTLDREEKEHIFTNTDTTKVESLIADDGTTMESQQEDNLNEGTDEEQMVVESSSEEAIAVRSDEDEVLPEDHHVPIISTQLPEDSAVPEQSSNQAAISDCRESHEPADEGIPLEQKEDTLNDVVGSSKDSSEALCQDAGEVLHRDTEEVMDTSHEITTGSQELHEQVTTSHEPATRSHEHMDDNEDVNEPMDNSHDQPSIPQEPEIVETARSFVSPNEDSSAMVSSCSDQPIRVAPLSVEHTSGSPDTTGLLQEDDNSPQNKDELVAEQSDPPTILQGLVDYPRSPSDIADESIPGDITGDKSDPEALVAPPSPAASDASTPSSASLSSLDELPPSPSAVVDNDGMSQPQLEASDVISSQSEIQSLEPPVALPEAQGSGSPDAPVKFPEEKVESPEVEIVPPREVVEPHEIRTTSPDHQVELPKLQCGSPEPQSGSPEMQSKSPEPHIESPETQKSTESQITSSEPMEIVSSETPKLGSPEPVSQSHEQQVKSPKSQIGSAEAPFTSEPLMGSPEMRTGSPEVLTKSAELQVVLPEAKPASEPLVESPDLQTGSSEVRIVSSETHVGSPDPKVTPSELQTRLPGLELTESQVGSSGLQITSPDAQVPSSESMVESPGVESRSPQLHIKSPEPQQTRSPEPQMRSPEPRMGSPEPLTGSHEPHMGSPEPQVATPEPLKSQSVAEMALIEMEAEPSEPRLPLAGTPSISEPVTTPGQAAGDRSTSAHSPSSPGSLIVEVGSPMRSSRVLSELHAIKIRHEEQSTSALQTDQEKHTEITEVLAVPLDDASIKERHSSIVSETSEQSCHDVENIMTPLAGEDNFGMTSELLPSEQPQHDAVVESTTVDTSSPFKSLPDHSVGQELTTVETDSFPASSSSIEDEEAISGQDQAPEHVTDEIHEERPSDVLIEDMEVSSSIHTQNNKNDDIRVVTEAENFENAPLSEGTFEEVRNEFDSSVSQDMETSEVISKKPSHSVSHVDSDLPSTEVGPNEDNDSAQVCEMDTDQMEEPQGADSDNTQQEITPNLQDDQVTELSSDERPEMSRYLSEDAVASLSSPVVESPAPEIQLRPDMMDEEVSPSSKSVSSIGSDFEETLGQTTPLGALTTTITTATSTTATSTTAVLSESGLEQKGIEGDIVGEAEFESRDETASHSEVEQTGDKVITGGEVGMPLGEDTSVPSVTLDTIGVVETEQVESHLVDDEMHRETMLVSQPPETADVTELCETIDDKGPVEAVIGTEPLETAIDEKPQESVSDNEPPEAVIDDREPHGVDISSDKGPLDDTSFASELLETASDKEPPREIVSENESLETAVNRKPIEAAIDEEPYEAGSDKGLNEVSINNESQEEAIDREPLETAIDKEPHEAVAREKDSLETAIEREPFEGAIDKEPPHEAVSNEVHNEMSIDEAANNGKLLETTSNEEPRVTVDEIEKAIDREPLEAAIEQEPAHEEATDTEPFETSVTASDVLNDNEACMDTNEAVVTSDVNKADSSDAAVVYSQPHIPPCDTEMSLEESASLELKTVLDQDNQITEGVSTMPEPCVPISAPQYSPSHVTEHTSSVEDDNLVSLIQDNVISSNSGLATTDTGVITSVPVSDDSTVSANDGDGNEDLEHPDVEGSSMATEVDIEEVTDESTLQTSSVVPYHSTESDDSGDSSDSSSSDSDSDDNQTTSSSSGQEDQMETSVVTSMETPVETIQSDTVAAAAAAAAMESESVKVDNIIDNTNDVEQRQQVEEDKVPEIVQLVIETVPQEVPDQPEVAPEKHQETVPEKSQETTLDQEADTLQQASNTVTRAHQRKMAPRPIPADATQTWESLGHESVQLGSRRRPSQQDVNNVVTISKQPPVSQVMSVGAYMDQYRNQLPQELSAALLQRSGVIVPQPPRHESSSKEEESQRASQSYLKTGHMTSTAIVSVAPSVAVTPTTMGSYAIIGTSFNQQRQSISEQSYDGSTGVNEQMRVSNATERGGARTLQQLLVGEGRTASTSHDPSVSGISAVSTADNVGSPSSHKGAVKDKFTLERVGKDSQGNVYWYDGGKNLYQTTSDYVVTAESMGSLAPLCNSMNKWLAKLKTLRSSGSDSDMELVKHIKENYIHRVHQAVQRRRAKIPGETGNKPPSRPYTPPKTPHGLTGNIQKQISTVESSVSVTAGSAVISQAPAKMPKQISTPSSSHSPSPQVSLPQQYIIQQSPQHPAAIYAMQLGAMIPGLAPMLDSSQQQSKVNETVSSSEQVKSRHETPMTSHQTAVVNSSSKNEDVSTSSAQPIIQTAPSDKSLPSSTISHSSSTNATMTVLSSSSSSSSAVVASSMSGVIMNPYQYYLATAATASVAGVSSSGTVVSSASPTASSSTIAVSSAASTTTQVKEKAVTYTVTSSKSPMTSATVSSSSTAVVTQPSATVATPTVMQAPVQYAMVGTGNQQQLYAMPGNAHIQTGFLFFQQPNGMMVAIPAQTVIQPGGSSQVAVAPQQVAAIANGTAAIQQSQQQQQQQKTGDASTTGEKSRAKSESEATSETTSKQQKQVYLPVMQQPYELKPPGGKGKRSSSSNASEDSTHKSSKDQVQSMRHHSASSVTAGHGKYQQLYIPRGAHAYRVAAAQAAAAQAANNQQSSSSTSVVSTSTTTSVTTSSTTTLEKTKESEEASVGSLVPIQVVHQQHYATGVKGDRYGVAQQSHKQITTSAGSSSSQKLAMTYAGGRPSVLFNTAAGAASSTSQIMLHAVSQGPSGVYEVKASSLAEIDPVFVKTLTDKYEHNIVKLDYQTAILNKSHGTEGTTPLISSEVGNKATKAVSFASHKDQNRQTPSSFEENVAAIDRTLASQQTISDDTTTITTTANKQTKGRRGATKKTPQMSDKEPGKDLGLPVTSPSEEPPGKQPQSAAAAARKRKGAKADSEGGQDTTQPAKRKRAPPKKKVAQAAEDAEEDSSKPGKVTPTQRGRKGKAANETAAKGTLKTAVVSIALDMLVDVPSPTEPDEEQYTKSGRKRKMLAEDSVLGTRRSKAALLAAHKTGKEPKRPVVDIDELSSMNAEALESMLNEITGGEEQEDIPSEVPSSRQKRKCVAVREKVTKLQQILEKQGANQKAAGNAGSVRKRKATQAATAAASTVMDDDDDNISSILPVSKPAHKKNRFPFSSSRSRRHRRKREEPLWQSASQKGGRFTRNAKCKAVYVFSTHLANEATKAVMNKTHKTIIRYHEQFASKAGYLHKLPQHKRLMQFNNPSSPTKDSKSLNKHPKGVVNKGGLRQQGRKHDIDEDDIPEDEEQSSSSDNSDSDSDSNSSSSQATNKNARHFSASSEPDSHDQNRERIDSHTSPPTSPDIPPVIPPAHNRPRWEAKSLFASRTEELLRAAEMAQQSDLRSQQGDLGSLDAQEPSEQESWGKELKQNQDVFSSPGSTGNHHATDRSVSFDNQSAFKSPPGETQIPRRRNLSSAIDVGSPTDVTQLLSSPPPAMPTEAYLKPSGPVPQSEEEEEENPPTGTQPFSLQEDHHLGGLPSSQYQPSTIAHSQPTTPHTPTLSDLSMQPSSAQAQQSQESQLMHKQAPKSQTLHHLPPPGHPSSVSTGQVNLPASNYDPRFLQQYHNQQQQQQQLQQQQQQQSQQQQQQQQQQPQQPQQPPQPPQKETDKSYSYPYASYLPSLQTHQQAQQQPGSSYKYPPHYPWASHYPYFSPSSGSNQAASQLQKAQERPSLPTPGIASPHLAQRGAEGVPGAAGHQLSHGPGGLAAGASPLMHTHATQHMSPAHLQQYMMGGSAMMQHEHYLAAQAQAYGYDQNSQQQALQFWQQQQQHHQQHQKQQYSGLAHGIHPGATQQLGAPSHPLGHAGLWHAHHHLQQSSQFGKSPLFGSTQVGSAKPQDSLFRLSTNQNNNSNIQGAVPMGHMYMGYAHFPRTDLGKTDVEAESWQPPMLKPSHYQHDTTAARMQRGSAGDSSRRYHEETCKKDNNAFCAAPTVGQDIVNNNNTNTPLPTSAILEQARKHSELMHGNIVTTTTVADT